MSWKTSLSLYVAISFIATAKQHNKHSFNKSNRKEASVCRRSTTRHVAHSGQGTKHLHLFGSLLFTLQVTTVLGQSRPPLIRGTDPIQTDWLRMVMRCIRMGTVLELLHALV